jgi:hypothetical protein
MNVEKMRHQLARERPQSSAEIMARLMAGERIPARVLRQSTTLTREEFYADPRDAVREHELTYTVTS